MELSRHIPGSQFIVSDLLERKDTDAEKGLGLDLTDYLLKTNVFIDKTITKTNYVYF